LIKGESKWKKFVEENESTYAFKREPKMSMDENWGDKIKSVARRWTLSLGKSKKKDFGFVEIEEVDEDDNRLTTKSDI